MAYTDASNYNDSPMARLRPLRAGIPFLIAVGVAVLITLGLSATSAGAGQSASIALVAIDADPSGNGPRTVGTIDQCVSTALGQAVDIDIVVASPGVPTDRGIAAYQFNIFYDPAIVWIDADDPYQLLAARADKSRVWPIADAKPDSDGVYRSWAVDFGPKAVEPLGASETGPGVLARITLTPRDSGASPLVLKDLLIIDHASQAIAVDSVLSATINIGQPCLEQRQQPAPSPTPASDSTIGSSLQPSYTTTPDPTTGPSQQTTPTPTPESSSGPDQQPSSTPSGSTQTPGATAAALAAARPPTSSSQANAVPTMGGPPPPVGGISPLLALSGLVATLSGAGLLVAGKLAFSAGTRRDTSPHQD